jgi:methyl-accepting chemotaxis protein
MRTWFENISVTAKLCLGFALVLALTALLALTGWTSLEGLIKRSNWMSDISQLNGALTNLRISRLQYMVADGDDTAAQAVQVKLEAAMAQQQKLLVTFKSPENVKRLQEQNQHLSDYQASLKHMRDAYTASIAHRKALHTLEDTITAQIASLDKEATAQPSDDAASLTRFQAITQVREQFQAARYDIRGYVHTVNADTEATAFAQVDATAAAVPALQAVVSGDKARFDDLSANMAAYRGALSDFKADTAKIASARAETIEQGNNIQRLSDELYQLQMDRRDQESQQARVVQVSAALLALILGALAAWLITRQITKPLQQTLDAVERIAAGDLGSTMTVTRRDELGVLQQGIQRMGTTLRQLITGIRDGVTQIASAAEELSAVTEQTSAGASTQRAETDQVATAMHEMTATVQEVARSAEQASEAAVAADHEAQAGDKVVAEAIVRIERLADEVRGSMDAMANLQAESNKIGSVMDVIKAVAEQTNLLALNAAIEAARAGEAGRGFAVVADEVRGLAQRTQKSTEEIEGLVAGLQNGTQRVVDVMLNSQALTNSSVELTRRAGSSLESITRTVSNIQAMNQQIATAAEQQSAVAEEISRSIVNVRDVSEQTATASEQTALSSAELARLGGNLQALVGHFRV